MASGRSALIGRRRAHSSATERGTREDHRCPSRLPLPRGEDRVRCAESDVESGYIEAAAAVAAMTSGVTEAGCQTGATEDDDGTSGRLSPGCDLVSGDGRSMYSGGVFPTAASVCSRDAVVRAIRDADHAMQQQQHLVVSGRTGIATPVRIILADALTDSAKRRALLRRAMSPPTARLRLSRHLVEDVRIVTDDGGGGEVVGEVLWVEDAATGRRQCVEVLEHALTRSRHVLQPDTRLYSDDDDDDDDNDDDDADDDRSQAADWVPRTLRRRRRSRQRDSQLRRRLPSVPAHDSADEMAASGRDAADKACMAVTAPHLRLPGFHVHGPWSEAHSDSDGGGSSSLSGATCTALMNTLRFTDGREVDAAAAATLKDAKDTLPQPTYLREYRRYIESFDGGASPTLTGGAAPQGTAGDGEEKTGAAGVADAPAGTAASSTGELSEGSRHVLTQTAGGRDPPRRVNGSKTTDFGQQTVAHHSTQTPIRVQLCGDARGAGAGGTLLGDTFVVESDEHASVIEPWDPITLDDLWRQPQRDFATQTFGQAYGHSHSHVQTQTSAELLPPAGTCQTEYREQPRGMGEEGKRGGAEERRAAGKVVPVKIEIARRNPMPVEERDIFDAKPVMVKRERKREEEGAGKGDEKGGGKPRASKTELLRFMLRQVRELKSQIEPAAAVAPPVAKAGGKSGKKEKQKENRVRKARGLLEGLGGTGEGDEKLYSRRRLELMYRAAEEEGGRGEGERRRHRSHDDYYPDRDRYPRRATTPPPSSWQHREPRLPVRQARADTRYPLAYPPVPTLPTPFTPQVPVGYAPPLQFGHGAFRPVSASAVPQVATPMHVMPMQPAPPPMLAGGAPIVFVPSEQLLPPSGTQMNQPYVMIASPQHYDGAGEGGRAWPDDGWHAARRGGRLATARTHRSSLKKSIMKATQAANEMKDITGRLRLNNT